MTTGWTPEPMPADETAASWQRLRDIPVADIADALDRLGFPGRALDPALRPLAPGMRCVGPAFCVLGGTLAAGEEDGNEVYRRLETAVQPGQILLIAGGAPAGIALFGGRLGRILHEGGCGGAIVDGALRDTDELLSLPGSAWFCRGCGPRSFVGRWKFRAAGVPVEIPDGAGGQVRVAAGDILCADADGILAIPAAVLPQLAML